jgi:3-hydroxy acid dehydrogenase/malonic semialdehyde reductase
VILVARRPEMLKQVAEQCHAAYKESGLSQGGKFATVQLDVSDKAQVAAFWDKVPNDMRDVDILGKILPYSSQFTDNPINLNLVNNAGYVLGLDHVGDIQDEVVEGMFATNVLGLISMTQLLVRGELRFFAGPIAT